MYIFLGGCRWVPSFEKQHALISIQIDTKKKRKASKSQRTRASPSHLLDSLYLRLDITCQCYVRIYREIRKEAPSSLLPPTWWVWKMLYMKHFLFLSKLIILKRMSPGGVQVQSYIFQKILSLESSQSLTCSVIYNPICSSITWILSIIYCWPYFIFMCHQVFKNSILVII